MTLPRKRLIDDISSNAPLHEVSNLIEALGVMRGSRFKPLHEAFSKDGSVAAAKLQIPADMGYQFLD